MDITLPLAFIAGLISFVSPCVLPLVPAYIGYMGGRMTHVMAVAGPAGGQSGTGWNQRFNTFLHSLAFVAGFAFVFVSLGIFQNAFISIIGGQNINAVKDLIARIGGTMIIFFGLHFMGLLPRWLAGLRDHPRISHRPLTSILFALFGSALIAWGFSGDILIWRSALWETAPWAPLLGILLITIFLVWLLLDGAFNRPAHFWSKFINSIISALYADTRREMQFAANGGYSSSALMGVVFSAGWTPCIGPVYGAVLTMAANGGDIGQAGALLTAYSLGLGIPFMLAALALDSAQNVLRSLQRHMHRIQLASGAFLLLIGLAVASGELQRLTTQFATGEFAEFAISMEESVLETFAPAPETAAPAANLPESDALEFMIDNPPTDQPAAQPGAAPAPTDALNENIDVPRIGSITALAAAVDSAAEAPAGRQAPSFETVTDAGRPLRLSDYRGQVVLLNFWATWCGPCRQEMPVFEQVYQQRQADGFAVVAVNFGESPAVVQDFRQEMGLTFPLAMDEQGDIQKLYGISGYPSTLILGRDGRIIAEHYGPLSASQIDELVNTALAS